MKIWEPKTPGTLWVTPGLLQEDFNFTFTFDLQETLNCATTWICQALVLLSKLISSTYNR